MPEADFLLIHGEKDVTVPIEQGKNIAKCCKEAKSNYGNCPDKGHSDCHFEEKVIGRK